ncbi:MAG: SdpI family protein [Sphaerochaeta sp.]|nr:SdpI family protein [Sphaerochaeta sp.]
MKAKIDKTMLITTLVCLVPLTLSAFLYGRLPDQVPIHFNLAGEADNYAPKAFGAFILPLSLALGNVLLQLVLNNDPKRDHGQPLREMSKWIIPILSLFITPLTLFKALGSDIRLERVLPVLVALLFLVIGNYLPKCKQNYTVGIKIPWTLASEENWNRTHRFAGWVWSIASLVLLVSALTGLLVSLVLPVTITAMVLLPVIYSFLFYKRSKGNDTKDSTDTP